jgi:hypothetical protein
MSDLEHLGRTRCWRSSSTRSIDWRPDRAAPGLGCDQTVRRVGCRAPALRPGGHHILELRYIEGHDVAEVMEQVALSSAQYHREHQRALQMIAVILWEQWQVGAHWPAIAGEPSGVVAGADLVRQEAEGLVHDRPAGRVDLAGVVQDLRLLLQPLCAERAVDLAFEVDAPLPALVGERVAVRQCCLTLLSHLVSAADHGAIRIRFARRPRQVVVTITGSATGDLGQIEVGVAECRPFLEALQGRLEAGALVAGSADWTIQVILPAYERPTLLVVDNNADFVRLIERYVTGGEWEVIGAGTVDEAVALAQQRRPTVILLDVIIPGRDGDLPNAG